MTDEYAEWLKAGNHRLSSVGDQPQQHGVGGVDVARRTWLTVGGIGDEQDAANWAYDHADALMIEIDLLRARCASLEAVVEAARGIALRQSPAHQALRQALAAIDQHAITTQEGTHG